MAFSGFYALVLRGEICQNAMDSGKLSQDAFTVGENGEFGKASYRDYNSKPSKGEKSIGISPIVDGSVVRAHQHAAGAMRVELDPNSELSAIEQVHYS